MKPLLALLGIATLSSPLQAAVAEGENLLINGTFDAEQVGFPEFWSPSSAKKVFYNRVGGPEGKKPSVVLKSDGKSGTISLRQQGMTLVAGEIHLADVRLEAVSEAAREGSTSQMSLVAVPRLVPLKPLLYLIDGAGSDDEK